MINFYELQKKSKYKKYSSSDFTLPEQNPEFINDISSFVECINKRNKFKLISKELIDLVNGTLKLIILYSNL